MITEWIVSNLGKLLQILLLLLVTWLMLKLIGVIARRWKRKLLSSKIEPDRLARLMTMENVLVTTLRGVILAVFVLTLLGALGFNLAPLLASAGIAGLAVSLGAQTLIRDFISGFLIVSENQFGVGDQVVIGNVTGTVEKISLRAVAVRGFDGSLHFIPNGEIRVVSNSSRDWTRATVDLILPHSANIGEVVQAFSEAVETTAKDEAINELLLEPPQVIGFNQMNEQGVQVRLTARAQVGQAVSVERIFRRCVLATLQQHQISLAVPAQEIYIQQASS